MSGARAGLTCHSFQFDDAPAFASHQRDTPKIKNAGGAHYNGSSSEYLQMGHEGGDRSTGRI
jgi:hypothetical protein